MLGLVGVTMRKVFHRFGAIVMAVVLSLAGVQQANANAVVKWTKRSVSGVHDWVGIANSTTGKAAAAVDYGGRIWTTANSGNTWTERTSLDANVWTAVAMSNDGKNLTAGAEDGSYAYSADSGATWTKGETTLPASVSCIAASDDGMTLAATVLSKSSVWMSTDGGATWSESASGVKQFQCVAISGDGQKVIATILDSGVYVSTDSGATWLSYFYSQKHAWAGASGIACSADCSSVVAVEQLGAIYQSSDSGVTWAKLATAGTGFNGVSSSNDGKTLATYEVNEDQDNGLGRIHLSFDAGKTWIKQTALPALTWPVVSVAGSGTSFIAMDAISQVYTSIELFAPTTPKIKVTYKFSKGKAQLKWVRPAATPERPILRFEYRVGSGKWISMKLTSTINLTKLTKGKTYVVQVRAVNQVGNSGVTTLRFKQKL